MLMDPIPMEHHSHSGHHLSHHHDLNGLTSLGGHEANNGGPHEPGGQQQLLELDQEREVNPFLFYLF